MPRIALFAGLVGVYAVSSGCAAVFGSKQKNFELQSYPQGAEVMTDGNRLGATPMRATLSNLKEHTFVFRKEGYKDATCTLTKGAGGGWIVLDVLFGLVPVIIDAATNSWTQTQGDSCNTSLEPLAGPVPAAVPASAPVGAVPSQPTTPQLVDAVPTGANWIASEQARVYYQVGCPAASNILPSDRLYYRNEQSLVNAGFVKASTC